MGGLPSPQCGLSVSADSRKTRTPFVPPCSPVLDSQPRFRTKGPYLTLIGWLAGFVWAERALYGLPCHLFLKFKSPNILCLSSSSRTQWEKLLLATPSRVSEADLFGSNCALILWLHMHMAACRRGWTGVPPFLSYGEVQLQCCDNILAIASWSSEVCSNPCSIPWSDASPENTTRMQ